MTEDEAWEELEQRIRQMKAIPALLKAKDPTNKYESMLTTFRDVTVYLDGRRSSKEMAKRCNMALEELKEIINRLGGVK